MAERTPDEPNPERRHALREEIHAEMTGGTVPENGVEGPRAIRAEQLLNTPLMIAAALTLPSVALTETHVGGTLEVIAHILNWGTYLVFALELVVMLILVPDRKKYLKHHPVELIVVFLTPPVLPASLQALRAIRLLRLLRLLKLTQLSGRAFSDRGLGYAALMTLVIAVAGGSVFRAFEKGHQHITEWDSVYWAVATMTTLGSQWEPSTVGSQITAIIVLLVGVSFIALLTGAIAHRFLGFSSRSGTEDESRQ
ncbi:MAG: two pore domain potassium channel family protein [Solirubrobacterales bacterium]|nr:two pore domain potassium channel family protein [Solirubrobacterales bacterium]